MSEETTTTKPQGLRKTRVGVVVSDKMSKTIVVEYVARVPHPVFKKIVKKSKKFYAHDENEIAKIGDKVRIRETRPLSALKRWELVEILKRSGSLPAPPCKSCFPNTAKSSTSFWPCPWQPVPSAYSGRINTKTPEHHVFRGSLFHGTQSKQTKSFVYSISLTWQ